MFLYYFETIKANLVKHHLKVYCNEQVCYPQNLVSMAKVTIRRRSFMRYKGPSGHVLHTNISCLL